MVYRLAPPLVAACLIAALMIVPVAGRAGNFGIGHDALVLVGLLALALPGAGMWIGWVGT